MSDKRLNSILSHILMFMLGLARMVSIVPVQVAIPYIVVVALIVLILGLIVAFNFPGFAFQFMNWLTNNRIAIATHFAAYFFGAIVNTVIMALVT